MTNLFLVSLMHRRVFVRLACEDNGSHYTLVGIHGEWLRLEKRPPQDGKPAAYRYVPFTAVAYIDADEAP